MRSFKKALVKVALFTLIFSLICSPFVYVYYTRGSSDNNFLPELDAEKGKIDFIFCGASQSVWGFIPQIMDEELSVNSFNISSGLLSMEGRYTIIRNVVKNNPVKTLVLDFSFNNLSRTSDTDTIEGELLLEEHLCGTERVKYFFTHTKPDELFSAFYYVFRTGLYGILHSGSENKGSNPYCSKGYWEIHEATDQRSAVYWKAEKSEQEKKPYNVTQENLYYLDQIMQLCREKGIRVCFVTTAYPTGVVSWSDRDGMLEKHLELAHRYDCPLYDFNLFRQKDEFFHDETSYYDVEHVSTEGAVAQTKLLASWIESASPGVGKDERFYYSYADMIRAYLQDNAAEYGSD